MDQNGVNVGIYLGNNQNNFQLHMFSTSKNFAKSFRGYFFDSHCIHRLTITTTRWKL